MNELDAELQNYMMAIQAKRALIQWLRLWRLFLERQCRWKTSPAGWFGYCRSGWQDEWGLQEYVAGGVRVSRQVVPDRPKPTRVGTDQLPKTNHNQPTSPNKSD